MQDRSLREEILQYTGIAGDYTMWTCAACTALNSLNYIQCSVCLANNEKWRRVLDAMSLPYQTRELDVKTAVKGLFRSMVLTSSGPIASLWDTLYSAAGYIYISNSWKCKCGTISSPSRVTCPHCFTSNSTLQALLDLIGFPYTLAISEHVEEDPLPISLLEPIEHQLHVSAGLLVWFCSRCTAENSVEYIQCTACNWVNEQLEQFNTILGVPVLRVKVPALIRLITGRREGNGEGSGLPVLKVQLEALTGLKEPYQMWTCPSCTLSNSYEYPQCRLCPYLNSSLRDLLRALNISERNRNKDITTIAKEAYHSILDRVQAAVVCPICEATIRSIEVKPLVECGHVFHPNCLKDHIGTTMPGKVKCPQADCQQEISTQDIQQVLTPYEFERYVEDSFKQYIVSQGEAIRACPTPDCSFSFIFNGEREFTCLNCHKSYCLRCHSNAHAPETCEDRRIRLQYLPNALELMTQCPVCQYRFKELDKGVCANCKVTYCLKCHVSHPQWTCVEYFRTLQKESYEDLFVQFASGSRFKICGNCGVWVEKRTGCNHITCRCGHQFCYICGKNWKLNQCQEHQFQ